MELIRPLLLWMLISGDKKVSLKSSIGKTLWLSLPYLALLGFYFWWRLIVFPTTVSRTNYAGDFKMFQDFQPSVLAGLFTLFTRAFYDLIYSTLQVWLTGITGQDGFTFQSKAVWFAFGVGIIITAIFAFFQDVEDETEPNASRPPVSLLLFGFWAFLTSSISTWLTSKQLSGGGRYDDRFSLAVMFGAGLMTLAFILWFIRTDKRKFLLGLLLVFSVTTQVLSVNKYRQDWLVQRDYYWQLAWRIPALKPNTAIVSWEQPSESVPGYDASFALNVLFQGKVVKGFTPYWFFTNDRFSNIDYRTGKPITNKDRNLVFTGNTSESISIIHQAGNRCLQVLDTVYKGEPFYISGQDQLLNISNVSRIANDSNAGQPDRDIFGSEPAHTWCTYFEKADLARQNGDWRTVLLLEKEAKGQGLSPKFGPEYIPFIEAHAQVGDWQQAYDLSLAAGKLTTGMEPLLCANWERLSKLPSANVNIVDKVKTTLPCPTP
jgi:hypothetical protein